jgi:hypothetical protein
MTQRELHGVLAGRTAPKANPPLGRSVKALQNGSRRIELAAISRTRSSVEESSQSATSLEDDVVMHDVAHILRKWNAEAESERLERGDIFRQRSTQNPASCEPVVSGGRGHPPVGYTGKLSGGGISPLL